MIVRYIPTIGILWVLMFYVCENEAYSRSKRSCPRPDEIAPCQCRIRGPTIQVRCTNSIISRITEAMQNLRKRIPGGVDILILENNNIPHLPSRAFSSVKVNRLFIENNRIMTIDRNAFAGLENFLSEIYIKEPSLKSLPKDSIDYLHELTVFSVENSQIVTMPKVVGLRKLKLFKIDGSQIREIPSQSLRNLPAIRYLHISNSAISRLDIGVLENVRQLVVANFTQNRITWIHPRAFRYMEQLKEISLKGNRLEDPSMIGRSMRVVKTLKQLDLSHNLIEHIPSDSFVDIISLEELKLDSNRIKDFKAGAFHRLPRLKIIDLSSNHISSFHSDTFMDIPQVEQLLLNNNDLNQISDISFVMDTLPKLRVLDLSHNDIRDIPFGTLRGYSKLERLYLSNNQISRISRQSLVDMKSMIELDLSDNKLIADDVTGDSAEPIFDLESLKGLKIARNKLSTINEKFLAGLPNLRRLDISQNGIINIHEDAFASNRQLDFLNISYNNIRELKPRLFENVPRLYEMDASHNELIALSDDLLGEQSSLEYMSLANNQIQLISNNLLPTNNRLRHLDLSANFIEELPKDLIIKLGSLEKVILRQNSLTSLNRGTFEGLKKLEVIDFHDNRIETIARDAFEGLTSLKGLDLSLNIINNIGMVLNPLTNLMKLNLSDNYITTLPKNTFKSLHRLSTLDVSNNTIVEIGDAFTDMSFLKYLDLSYNHLPTIKRGAFRDMPDLIGLRFDHNSIVEVEPGAFQDLPKLETLILTKNGMSRINRNTFKNLPSLQKIKLNDNLIQELEDKSFYDLLSLKELHLEHNLIDSINDRAFLRVPSLRYLNMSFNLLQDLPRSGFLKLKTLETLDLSFNDLREVDERTFEDMHWLSVLKLNDNNICRINRHAFRDTASLRSIALSNNRITSIHQSALRHIQGNIEHLNIAGNPLTCDCETLWLRKLVSEYAGVVEDEPRCYSPKELAGNPLRKLRTSRFTCDNKRSRNDEDTLYDACHGIPLKEPVQQHLQTAIESGAYPYTGTYVENQQELLGDNEQEKAENTENDKQDKDVDVVDVDSDVTTKGDGDETYEYYYVYYDEDGNIVNKNQTPSTLPVIKDKVQEIPLTPIVKQSNKNQIPISDDEKAGDSPTIYAQIQNINDQENSEKGEEPEKEEEGLTIFGIPIPKIPLPILSFGLTPAFSHGLLPIGRKGDPSSTEDDVIRTRKRPNNTRYKQKQPETPQQLIPDMTRGPDNILDPIWIEGLQKAASGLFGTKTSLDQDDTNNDIQLTFTQKHPENVGIYHAQFPQRPFRNPHTNKGFTKAYGYLRPQNPIIPLKNTGAESIRYTMPQLQNNNGHLPAIKFDHPIPSIKSMSIQSQSENLPISLAPSLKRQNTFSGPNSSKKYMYAPEGNNMFKGGGIRVTDRWESESGFVPIFNPDHGDPVYLQQAQQPKEIYKQSAFPGIDATLRNEPIDVQPNLMYEGEHLSSMPLNIQRNKSTTGNRYHLVPGNNLETSSRVRLNVPYSSNGKYNSQEQLLDQEYYGTEHHAIPIPLVLRPTKIPPRRTTPPPVVWGQSSFDLSSIKDSLIGTEYVYDDYSDSDVHTDDDIQKELYPTLGSFRENSRSTTVKQTAEEIKLPSSTTERHVPTLSVEEVLPTEDSSRGPLDYNFQATELVNNDLENTSTEREHRTGSSLLPTVNKLDINDENATKEGEYEYEYYYEYYEDNGVNATTDKEDYTYEDGIDPVPEKLEIPEQVSSEDVVSLQNILNLIDGKTETTHHIASTVHSLMVQDIKQREMSLRKEKKGGEQQINKPPFVPPNMKNMPPKFRATLPPPIRTSTFVPYENNFLDSQRSTVTVDYRIQHGSLTDDMHNIRGERDGQSVVRVAEGDPHMVRSKGNSGVASNDNFPSFHPKGRSSNDPSRLPTPDASGASPFHPDQMDPVSAVENRNDKNNEVKWYYSNYNSENINPYISPSRANKASGSAAASLTQPMFIPVVFIIIHTIANILFFTHHI